MGKRDPRVDAYIGNAAPFAQPILSEIRDRVHAACPDVEEALKWSMPSFMYAGRILAGMASFKHHASFGYWSHAEVMGEGVERDGMGSYGKMVSLKELPTKKRMQADIKRAMAIYDAEGEGAAPRKPAKKTKSAATLPKDLLAALKKNAAARKTFEGFPPSAKREYIDWIVEAKREDTRTRRLLQAVEWMADGKRRHWKYERC